MLSSANFTVSHVKFRYMMYFVHVYIRYYGCIEILLFFFLICSVVGKKTFSTESPLHLCQNQLIMFCGGLPQYLDYVTLEKVLKSARFQMIFSIVLYPALYQKCFSNLFLCHLIILKSSLSLSTKKKKKCC